MLFHKYGRHHMYDQFTKTVTETTSNITGVLLFSLQCMVSKLLDSIVTNHLNLYLTNIVYENQHGFIKNRSTTITNLAEFTSNTIINMGKDIGYQISQII